MCHILTTHAHENIKRYNHPGKSLRVSEEVKNTLVIQHSHLTPGHLSKRKHHRSAQRLVYESSHKLYL